MSPGNSHVQQTDSQTPLNITELMQSLIQTLNYFHFASRAAYVSFRWFVNWILEPRAGGRAVTAESRLAQPQQCRSVAAAAAEREAAGKEGCSPAPQHVPSAHPGVRTGFVAAFTLSCWSQANVTSGQNVPATWDFSSCTRARPIFPKSVFKVTLGIQGQIWWSGCVRQCEANGLSACIFPSQVSYPSCWGKKRLSQIQSRNSPSYCVTSFLSISDSKHHVKLHRSLCHPTQTGREKQIKGVLQEMGIALQTKQDWQFHVA